MPTRDGSETRQEKSVANKRAFAVARVEERDEARDVTQYVDPYREREYLPAGLVNGNKLRSLRGDRSDQDCVAEVCELVACGITRARACEAIGIPHTMWYRWKRLGLYNIPALYEFAKECQLDMLADRTLDIADEDFVDPEYDSDGNLMPGSRSIADQIKIREMRIRIKQWHLARLDARFADKKVVDQTVTSVTSISQKLDVKMSPSEAMKEYVKMLELKPV